MYYLLFSYWGCGKVVHYILIVSISHGLLGECTMSSSMMYSVSACTTNAGLSERKMSQLIYCAIF